MNRPLASGANRSAGESRNDHLDAREGLVPEPNSPADHLIRTTGEALGVA
jgi:hypothetical protein